ncbi:hypothetical protein OIU76_023247 [Salix suchowensis]|nr:hypothetical protein OIU76_023247 [Salix suchowensis]
MIEQQIIYETLPKFCSHCNVLGHLVETCTKYAKRNNFSAANVVRGHVSVSNGVGGKDAMPAEDANADGKWKMVKKKQKSNWHNKKIMAENVSGAAARATSGAATRATSDVAARAASGVTNSAASGVAGMGADIAPVSGVAAKAMSGVATKAVSGVTGMGANIAPVSGAAARPAISMAAKAVSGVPDVGVKITPVGGGAGLAAGVDPLVAAWAVSGVIVGADSGIANGAKIVGAKVATGTETIGTAVVTSVEPPLKDDSRPKNHANRNSSKGKHIVEEVHGVTTRKGSKSKSSSSGNGRTIPTNPAL